MPTAEPRAPTKAASGPTRVREYMSRTRLSANAAHSHATRSASATLAGGRSKRAQRTAMNRNVRADCPFADLAGPEGRPLARVQKSDRLPSAIVMRARVSRHLVSSAGAPDGVRLAALYTDAIVRNHPLSPVVSTLGSPSKTFRTGYTWPVSSSSVRRTQRACARACTSGRDRACGCRP